MLLAWLVVQAGAVRAAGGSSAATALAHTAAQDSPCSAEGISRFDCLGRGQCMFVEYEGGGGRCTPCEFDGVDLPCMSAGAVDGSQKVKTCSMSCAHQKIMSIVSPCEDTTGDITLSQCHAKGASALTKCMWTQEDLTKGFCGPCSVMGVGTVPCPPSGGLGMTGIVTLCVSQCDDPCPPMFPGCTPTGAPPPLPNLPFPASATELRFGKDAPDYTLVKVLPPYDKKEWEAAARTAAQTAMWGPNDFLPPTAPVSIYGPPPPEGPTLPPGMPVMYGPAPPGMLGAPPPGYGYGTAPPPAQVEMAKAAALVQTSDGKRRPRLRRGRGTGH